MLVTPSTLQPAAFTASRNASVVGTKALGLVSSRNSAGIAG